MLPIGSMGPLVHLPTFLVVVFFHTKSDPMEPMAASSWRKESVSNPLFQNLPRDISKLTKVKYGNCGALPAKCVSRIPTNNV